MLLSKADQHVILNAWHMPSSKAAQVLANDHLVLLAQL